MQKALSFLQVTAAAIAFLTLSQLALAATVLGEPAPALVATDLSGGAFDLGALRGKVVVVNFWATWCGPCRTEMPVLDTFYRQHHAQGLEIIAVSADRPRDRDDVVNVMKAFSYSATMLKDAKENGFGAPRDLPITYVIDRGGVLRAVLTPDKTEITPKSLDDIVLPLLQRAASNSSPAASAERAASTIGASALAR
jgi:cytochrome c biogenesis protein CcmG, thiol:disulfide interchange protein DsbE